MQPEDDLLPVNCGRCGKRILVRVEEVRELRIIDCAELRKEPERIWTETAFTIHQARARLTMPSARSSADLSRSCRGLKQVNSGEIATRLSLENISHR